MILQRTPVPDSSPPAPPPTAPAPTDTAGPSYTSQQSPEHIHVSSRELAAVMDVVCALATIQVSLDQRMARAEVTLAQNQAMLLQIMSHLGLTSQRYRACTADSRSVHSSSLLGYAGSRCSSFRSTDIYTATRVRWSHSLLYLSDPYPVETCLYFGWGENLELEVSFIIFCLVFSFINCLLILYRIV